RSRPTPIRVMEPIQGRKGPVRTQLKKRAVSSAACGKARAAPCGRAVEIAVAPSDKRIGIKAICAVEGKKDINAPFRGDAEQSALPIFASVECRAVEVAITPEGQERCRRTGAERSQTGVLAGGSDGKHRPPAEQTAPGGRPIK